MNTYLPIHFAFTLATIGLMPSATIKELCDEPKLLLLLVIAYLTAVLLGPLTFGVALYAHFETLSEEIRENNRKP